MKKILFILALFFSFAAAAQNPTNYTRIGNRYRWISGMFDSALYVPRYNGTPSGVRAGEVSVIDGMVAVDTANSRFYIYSGGAWVRVANYSEILNIYNSDGTLTGNRTLTTGGYYLQFYKDANGYLKFDGSTRTQTTYVNNGTYNTQLIIGTSGGLYSVADRSDVSGGGAVLTGTYDAASLSVSGPGQIAGFEIDNDGVAATNTLLYVDNPYYGVSVDTSAGVMVGKGLTTNNKNLRGVRVTPTWQVYLDSIDAGPGVYNVRIDADGKLSYADTTSGGTPGGSTKQIQYNNAGSFGGSANMTQETGQILITSTSSTNPFVVKGHEDNGQGSLTEWQEHSTSAVLASVNQDTTISLRDYSGTVTTPAANFGKVYSRDDSLRFKNSAGTEFTLGTGGGGSGTVNSGTTPRMAYYPSSGTTVDDAAGVEYGNSNILFRSQSQAATDVAIVAKAHASQSANIFEVQNSSGTAIVRSTAAGRFGATDYFEIIGTDIQMGNVLGTGYNVLMAGATTGIKFRDNTAAVPFIWEFGFGSGPRAQLSAARMLEYQGTDVASVAGAIALTYGNTFEITGTNAITLISNVNWQNGSIIYLVFTSTATLTDGTANSGTDIGMELAGGANFTGSADDVVTLVLSEVGGTQRWREVSRSVN